ncbi:MAG: hypothetical protein GWO02_17140, partial [Gammaproteobacteria bacterium]|nr:hypothetical protein [Gammaproteobacteria bacterium]
ERCLRKAPESRLDSLIAARLEIEEAGGEPAGDTAAGTRPSALALGAVAAAALLVGVWLGFTLAPNEAADSGEAESEAVRRALVPLPPGTALSDDALAFSRDGTTVVFAARTTAKPRLYLHRLDSMQTEEIPGTEGAAHPFFSPDGGHVGFFVGGQLRKVSVRGGSRDVTVLCDAPTGQSGAWDSSGWIYFTFGESRLARVREAGGEPEQIEKLSNVFGLRALPDGRGILLTEHASDAPSIRKDTAKIGVLSLQDGSVTPVLSGGYNPRYLSSGHLVFMRNGSLFAVRFDLETLTPAGPEVSVQPGV